ncbi:hypothetical protein [Mitsuaria sp. WAJ17]|nr:hypothetical protein [Mitsuaria sp. WAJ17]
MKCSSPSLLRYAGLATMTLHLHLFFRTMASLTPNARASRAVPGA